MNKSVIYDNLEQEGSGWGTRKCKGLELGNCLEDLKKCKTASWQERVGERDVRKVGHVLQALEAVGRAWVSLSIMGGHWSA